MRKIYAIIAIMMCFSGSCFAQILKGYIYDAETSEPLVGATVSYKLHGNQGVISDANGACRTIRTKAE